jgi:hypothetical protein
MDEPWTDYLALPVAPTVIFVQCFAFAISNRRVRWAVAIAGPTAVLALLAIVYFAAEPTTGADIGAGLLTLELLVSVGVAAAVLLRDIAREGAQGRG